MEYKFTKDELLTWFMESQLTIMLYPERVNKSNLNLLTKNICEIKGLSFDKCSNIRIETYDLYAPKLIFDNDQK